MTIYFYTKIDEYGDFSNFANYGIMMNDKWWATVEHYYQAMKFEDQAYQEKIRMAYTPKKAKAIAFQNRAINPNWNDIKYDIMYQAVLKKFQTHKELQQRLLETGNEYIVENAPSDYYWGCGADGTGQNKLGEILMQIRNELKKPLK